MHDPIPTTPPLTVSECFSTHYLLIAPCADFFILYQPFFIGLERRLQAYTCKMNELCECPEGYYCTANSRAPKECATQATCPKKRCVNQTCNPVTDNRQKKTFLTKLADFSQAELSLGVSLNLYTDISAATFNGGNGFGFDIELPFNWLPNVSILYTNAPPLHCFFKGRDAEGKKLYKFAGIGLSTPIQTSIPIRNNADTNNEAIRDSFATAAAGLKEEAKGFRAKLTKFVNDNKEPKVSGNSFGVGYGYSYDASFNTVENRYD